MSPLETGPLHWFRDWPNPQMPAAAAGVYTIWDAAARLVYAGMAGRGFTAQSVTEHRAANTKKKGLRSRLESHWSGRRSGDQFCVCVAIAPFFPHSRATRLRRLPAAMLRLDALVQKYVHEHLAYRFLELPDAKSAESLERQVRRELSKPASRF